MGKPNAVFRTRSRRTRRFWARVLSRYNARKETLTKEEYIAAIFATTSFQERTRMQAEMENKNPDVQFIQETLVGSLMASIAEGDSSCSKIKTSIHSRTVQAHSNVFSDSVVCMGTHDQSKATTQFTSRWAERRQRGESNISTGFNDKFLDCEFNVNPGLTSAQLVTTIKHHVSSTHDDTGHERTLETYLNRIIFMGMKNGLEANYKLHKNDDFYTQSAQELSDYAARFRPGYWRLVGQGSESTWKTPESRTDMWTKMCLRILHK